MQEAGKPPIAILRPDRAASKDWESTEHMFIEGDSLEALKLLQESHAGRVKMIYIDPPYNTGNDLGYRDKYTHSDWLNMMVTRLMLARDLLQEEGVIFISIDDHEVHHLRVLCDELFGERNFLGIFTNCSTPNARDYGAYRKRCMNSCLYYAKNAERTRTNLLVDKEKTFRHTDAVGGFNVHPLYNSNTAFTDKNRPNLYYPFYLYADKPLTALGEGFFEIGLEAGAGEGPEKADAIGREADSGAADSGGF